MKKVLIIAVLITFPVLKSVACSCHCEGDCSFSKISNEAEFVALIRVVSYADFLKYEVPGNEGKMPGSMVVEVIKKYKGKEERTQFKIWGDNGVLCRPYISAFKIGEYYLIAPVRTQEDKGDSTASNNYTFNICNTDYLKTDINKKVARGEYSKTRSTITLGEFENKLGK